ncbi:helix-turn-helix domain-containing protein [Asticcacaulis sp.]|jgi:excisionase family DNA binding protein|uniref:helix-turn-helix domain-containing protein n=1 Tax=Asticcacaulis sp. TaxID=1872648 RepID=UPI0039E4844F
MKSGVRGEASMPVQTIEKIAYGIDEAVKASGLGRTFLYERIACGDLRSIKIGRRRLILHADLVAFLTNFNNGLILN